MDHLDIGQPTKAAASSASRAKIILLAGTTAGALDILFAISMWYLLRVSPQSVLQSIASGILGKASYNGGLMTGALGLGLHFMMAICMAWIFAAQAPIILRQKPLLGGSLYGVGIWTIMNFIVVPLSAAPIGLPPAPIALADIAAHMFLVGVPIAYLTAMYPRAAA